MKTRILIDATSISDQFSTRGVGTYSKQIVSKLIKNKDVDWHIIGFEEAFENLKLSRKYFHSLGSAIPSTPKSLIDFRVKFIPIIKKVNPDLYFSPQIERGLPIGLCKTAVFVHDVIPYKTNSFSGKGLILNLLKGVFLKHRIRQAKKADLVLTNSNFTKKELIDFGFDKEKVRKIYFGYKEVFKNLNWTKLNPDKILEKYSIKKPYIYYNGGLEENKNADKILESFGILKSKMEKINLVFGDKNLFRVGGKVEAHSTEAQKFKKIINTLPYQEEIFLPGYVEDKHMPLLLNQAELFMHLSSYEGFGFSVAEAMKVGTPIVASDASCYPEILGDAAILVDPDEPMEVANVAERILSDSKLSRKLSQKGKEKAQEFSWDQHVKKTMRLFNKTINEK